MGPRLFLYDVVIDTFETLKKVTIMQSKVTEVQIIPTKPKDGLVGFASFVFDNSFYFTSVGIYTRPQGGYRLTYPTRKSSASSLHIFHPIDKKVAEMIEAAVVGRYEEVIGTTV